MDWKGIGISRSKQTRIRGGILKCDSQEAAVEDGETSTETNTCTRNSTGIIGLRLPGSPISLEVEEVEGIGITEVGGEN
jgi:hypothetical protein